MYIAEFPNENFGKIVNVMNSGCRQNNVVEVLVFSRDKNDGESNDKRNCYLLGFCCQ